MINGGTMRKTLLIILLLGAFVLSGCQPGRDSFAKIGENEISKESFDKYMLLTKISYDLSKTDMPQSGEELRTLKINILDNMVEGVILVESAKKMGIEVDRDIAVEEAESVLEMMLDSYGEENYLELLDEYGVERSEFEKFVKELSGDNQMIFSLYEKVTEGVEVTESEALQHYQENIRIYNYSTVHTKGMVFSEKDLGEKVLDDIKNGIIDIEEAIETYGEDSKVLFAGDYGPLYYTDVAEKFAEKIFEADIGETTALVESDGLYYLGYVYSRDDMEPVDFADVEDTVYERVLSQKRNEAYEEFFQQEKEAYEIEVYYDSL